MHIQGDRFYSINSNYQYTMNCMKKQFRYVVNFFEGVTNEVSKNFFVDVSYEGDINSFKWNCIFSNVLIDAARHSLQNCMKLFISKSHISLGDILALICRIQRMKDNVNAKISNRVFHCLLYVKFDKLKLKYLQIPMLSRYKYVNTIVQKIIGCTV